MPANSLFCTQVVLSFLFELYKLKLILAFTLKYLYFRTAVKITVFWDVILCSLVKVTNTEDGNSLFLQVKVHFCQSVWCHIPEVIIFIVTSVRTWHLTAILLSLLCGFRCLQNSCANPNEHFSWFRCLLDQKACRTPSLWFSGLQINFLPMSYISPEIGDSCGGSRDFRKK